MLYSNGVANCAFIHHPHSLPHLLTHSLARSLARRLALPHPNNVTKSPSFSSPFVTHVNKTQNPFFGHDESLPVPVRVDTMT